MSPGIDEVLYSQTSIVENLVHLVCRQSSVVESEGNKVTFEVE